MTNRWKRIPIATAALMALGVALASGCELAVKLDLSLADADAGPVVCAICLDGAVEPDGNIVYGPPAEDAGADGADAPRGDAAAGTIDSGPGDAAPDADP